VLHTLAQGADKSFLRWVISKDFPAHVIEICTAALDQSEPDFLRWVSERFGQPAPTAVPGFTAPPSV
jgi:hypothetical protein